MDVERAVPSSLHPDVRHTLLGVAVDDVLPETWDCHPLVARALRESGAAVDEVEISVAAGTDRRWVVEARNAVLDRVPAGAGGAPHVLHAVGWPATLAAVAARPLRSLPAVVAHLGNGPGVPGRTIDPDLHRLAWVSARAADAVVLDSSWAVDQAVAQGVPRRSIVQTVPVGAPAAGDPTSWRRHDGPARVLAVGGIGPLAGTHAVVRAVSGLDSVDLVVGARPEVSDGQLAAAQAWVDEQCRRCDTGAVQVVRITPEVLAGVDLVVDAGVVPGRVDGLVRAMAFRRAVLTTGVGSRAEVVSPATTGEVVEAGDWRPLRRSVAALLDDPFKLEAYGDAGLERFLAVHTPQRRALVTHDAALMVGPG